MTLLEDTHKLPTPSNIKSIDPGENAFVNLVQITIKYPEESCVKITSTIPGWMNDYAVARGWNFSAILEEGLMERINNG